MSKIEVLSANELKAKLFNSVKNNGILDQLKAQFRTRIISEIRRIRVNDDNEENEELVSFKNSISCKAINSLISEHLSNCNYDYTMSVFMPESNLNNLNIFQPSDICRLLSISEESLLFKRIMRNDKSKHGFLWNFLEVLASLHGNKCQSVSIQTETVLGCKQSLEDKFYILDKQYEQLKNGGVAKEKMEAGGDSSETKLIAYQKQLESRSLDFIRSQLSRFKENELNKMRFQEREQYNNLLVAERKKFENEYNVRMESLRERERAAIDRLKDQQQIKEKEVFNSRQSLLSDIESVADRESDLKRKIQVFERECQLWKEKNTALDVNLKCREDELSRRKLEYDVTLSNDVTRFKLETQNKFLERSQSLELREAKVQDEERGLHEKLKQYREAVQDNRVFKEKNQKLELELARTLKESIMYERENEILNEKTRNMIDYPHLREQNLSLKKELQALKNRIAELQHQHKLDRQGQDKLIHDIAVSGGAMDVNFSGNPILTSCSLKRRNEQLTNDLERETLLYNQHRMQLQNQLQLEVERNKELIAHFESQNAVHDELSSELDIVKDKLHKSEKINGSVMELPSMLESPSISFAMPNCGATLTPNQSEDYSYSLEVVRETKNRLQHLESETQKFESHFKDYQKGNSNRHKQISSTIADLVTIRNKRELTNDTRAMPPPMTTQVIKRHPGPRQDGRGVNEVKLADSGVSSGQMSNRNKERSDLFDRNEEILMDGILDVTPPNQVLTRPMSSTPSKLRPTLGKDIEGRLYNNTALMNASISTVQSLSPNSSPSVKANKLALLRTTPSKAAPSSSLLNKSFEETFKANQIQNTNLSPLQINNEDLDENVLTIDELLDNNSRDKSLPLYEETISANHSNRKSKESCKDLLSQRSDNTRQASPMKSTERDPSTPAPSAVAEQVDHAERVVRADDPNTSGPEKTPNVEVNPETANSPSNSPASASAPAEEIEDENAGIDPVMLRYMQMVQIRKSTELEKKEIGDNLANDKQNADNSPGGDIFSNGYDQDNNHDILGGDSDSQHLSVDRATSDSGSNFKESDNAFEHW